MSDLIKAAQEWLASIDRGASSQNEVDASILEELIKGYVAQQGAHPDPEGETMSDSQDPLYGEKPWLPEPSQQDADGDDLRGAFSEALRDVAYSCTRVWEAWQYGTMTQDDFTPAWEDEELLDSLVEAALARRSQQEAPTGEVQYRYRNPRNGDITTGFENEQLELDDLIEESREIIVVKPWLPVPDKGQEAGQ